MRVCEKIIVETPDGGAHTEYSPVADADAKKWILEQAAKLAEAEPHTNAETRKNSVRLDPVRLRMAFPGGVPDVRLPEIFADPERFADIWKVLEYIFGGTMEYKTAAERNIDSLIDRMTK